MSGFDRHRGKILTVIEPSNSISQLEQSKEMELLSELRGTLRLSIVALDSTLLDDAGRPRLDLIPHNSSPQTHGMVSFTFASQFLCGLRQIQSFLVHNEVMSTMLYHASPQMNV